MFGALDMIKMGAAATVAALAAGSIAYFVGFSKGDSAGYQRYAAEQAVEDLQFERERKADDARLNNLSDYDFCVDSLNRRNLPVDPCERLRGVHEE